MKIIKKLKNWNPSSYAILLFLLLPLMYFVLFEFKLDNDFWFLINTGKTILKEGFIRIETFTIHNDLAFIAQQWLTDVIFYLVYNNFGIKGMYFLIIILNIIITFVFYKISFLLCKDRKKASFVAILVDFFILFYGVIVTRPQIFDVLLFSLEIMFLELYIANGKKKYLFFLPLVSLLLVNLHSSMFLMFFVLMAPYYAEYFISRLRKKNIFKIKHVLIVTIISFLVGFINPYGVDAMLYLFNSFGINTINSFIIEMTPINIYNGLGEFIVIGLVFLTFYLNKGKNRVRFFLLFLGLTYLALCHGKGIIEFGIMLVPVLSYNLKNETKKIEKMSISYVEKFLYVGVICYILIMSCFNMQINDKEKYKTFVDYLNDKNNYDIKIYTGYDEGGYFEYYGYKCYMDARAEVFLKANNKKEDIFDEYYNVYFGNISAKDFLDKYNFDYLLLEADEKYLLNELNKNNGYELLLTEKDEKKNREYYFYGRKE